MGRGRRFLRITPPRLLASRKGIDGLDAFHTGNIPIVRGEDQGDVLMNHQGGKLTIEMVLPSDLASHAKIERRVMRQKASFSTSPKSISPPAVRLITW